MAVPTFTSITPTTGSAGGRNLTTIIGTNFRLPTDPGFLNTVASPPSVKVEIDGVEATRVDVLSATELRVLMPPYRREDADAAAVPLPKVDVLVRNVDDSGVLIPGEEVTSSNAYTYRRSNIRAPDATTANQTWRQVIREVVMSFQRQLLPNTAIFTNVDYGDDGAIVVKDAVLPSITLVGPRPREDLANRHHWNDFEEVGDDGSPETFERFWPSTVSIFEFDVLIASDNPAQMYGLQQGTIELSSEPPSC
jgi:hypothetical protein